MIDLDVCEVKASAEMDLNTIERLQGSLTSVQGFELDRALAGLNSFLELIERDSQLKAESKDLLERISRLKGE